MKRSVLIIIVALAVCFAVFAEDNLWSGTATRGNDDAFPASGKDKIQGISMALPEGTVVEVRNQKNNLSALVSIVNGNGKPGIFLLLNSAASDSLDIHAGEVIMVEIKEKSSSSNAFLSYSEDPENFKSELNDELLGEEPSSEESLVDVDSEMEKMGYDSSGADEGSAIAMGEVPVDEPMEEIIITAPPLTDSDSEEIIIAKASEDYDDELEIEGLEEGDAFISDSISLEDDVPKPVPLETEDVIADDETSGMSDEEPVTEESPEEIVINPDRVIYFLTPAELRPPEAPETAEELLPLWDDTISVDEGADDPEAEGDILSAVPAEDTLFVPQYVESKDLEDYMDETVKTGSRYIQVLSVGENEGSLLYGNMEKLQENFPYLPMLVLPSEKSGFIRLLAGPVSRDEVGILLYAMKAHGFPDAFMKKE